MGVRTIETLRQIVRRFPSATQPEMVFAYGSGVFQQTNHTPLTSNMIDMCFVVDAAHVSSWHAENLLLNAGDYSFLKYLGPERIGALQDSSFGAKVRKAMVRFYVSLDLTLTLIALVLP